MSNVEVPVQNITRDGQEISFNTVFLATNDTFSFTNDGRKTIQVFKFLTTVSGNLTVEFILPAEVDGQTINPRTWVIPLVANTERVFIMPPLDAAHYNNADGKVTVKGIFSGLGTTTFKVAAIYS